ncbi:response regulator transcription factor [Conexibacter sp. SYSU D00693]|uniref:response regulator transcription factor n=1 Tax=Conexibacter sp. SYSU D00693 TaxID=2812560 RepID=UPI00196A4FA7|nr:response regulator transcription factor [Conexibacter sp. SYSU D00693]
MADRARILVVDDSEVVRSVVRLVLERGGFDVREATDGREAMKVVFAERVDAVLLDVEMPELDGWATLERIREVTALPVCMLTAQDAELAKVRGLRGGADDYLVKPFGNQELLARVEALVRRGKLAGSEGDTTGGVADRYDDGVLVVDHDQRLVRVRDQEVPVTPSEFALLAAFVRNPGVVLSPDRLAELAFGVPEAADNQVKLYVSRLRRKLGSEVEIETLRGFGYRLSATR